METGRLGSRCVTGDLDPGRRASLPAGSARLICAPAGEPRPGPARLRHGTVPVMATKAERRAARERVSAYHQSQLAGLLGHVGAEIDRYRAGEIDAYAADETIHHCHRAAAELWKFSFARGGGAHAEFIVGLLDRMTADAQTIDWWERTAPRRHQ
jgi:hypothetical protein